MKVRYLSIFAASALALTTLAVAAPEDQWIAKARAFVGKDAVLDAVTSMHIIGTLENENGALVPVEIICQKPNQRIIKMKFEKFTRQITLDGYDGWLEQRDLTNSSNWQLTLMDRDQIKHTRADNAETLYFFKGIEKRGGRIEYLGEAKIDGRDTVKLAYIYASNIFYHRYIDKATGQQLLVENENGGTIREEGEIVVDGIRFSKRIINRSADGKTNTLTIEKLKLNTVFPKSDFSMPDLVTK